MARRQAVESALRRLVAVPLIALSVCAASCGNDEGPGPGMTAAQHNEAGWTSYSAQDYSSASAHFSDALGLDPGLTEARLGLAWCEAQEGGYSAALDDFDEVIDAGEYVADAFAGRSATALAASEDSLAIASAESTLAIDAEYEFHRQNGYNWRDLRLIMAQAYFALARYEEAQGQVDILDVDNGLDPGAPGTWVVNGVAHPTYQAALAMEIEVLLSVEGGGVLARTAEAIVSPLEWGSASVPQGGLPAPRALDGSLTVGYTKR
jgi:tetratricopeptide (TPR) repeat protein